jgi:hypothetical protein
MKRQCNPAAYDVQAYAITDEPSSAAPTGCDSTTGVAVVRKRWQGPRHVSVLHDIVKRQRDNRLSTDTVDPWDPVPYT